MSERYALLEIRLDRARRDVDDAREAKHLVLLRRVCTHLVEVLVELGQPPDEFVPTVDALELSGYERLRADGLVALRKS